MAGERLIRVIRNQIDWRDHIASEYPDDLRNASCIRALGGLIEYIESGEAESRSPRIIATLEQHIPDHGQSLGGPEAQRELSRYGFGYETTALAQHEEFLSDLWVACMADAYEDASASEGDWTGTLEPFEIQAATDDVHLPRRYWELRPTQHVTELEDAIAAYRADFETAYVD